VPWVESVSPSFIARHGDGDADDAARVLETLEHTRDRLGRLFPREVGDVTVVLHDAPILLDLAHPILPVVRFLTAPAGRRYLAGWFGRDELHVLAPRRLAERASNVPGSLEMLMLVPAALYAQLVVGANNPRLPPPFTPRRLPAARRWGWLLAGAGQFLSGQTEHVRPAIARRLREGGRPAFPPRLRDAALLGGSVLDLLAREEGPGAVVRLLTDPPPRDVRGGLVAAFGGRAMVHTEGAWRSHLARMAGG
jgi:hypothetical protein